MQVRRRSREVHRSRPHSFPACGRKGCDSGAALLASDVVYHENGPLAYGEPNNVIVWSPRPTDITSKQVCSQELSVSRKVRRSVRNLRLEGRRILNLASQRRSGLSPGLAKVHHKERK